MNNFEDIFTATNAIDLASQLENNLEIERNSQVGFDPEKLVPQPTYIEAGVEKIAALCAALELQDRAALAIEIFRGMTASWGDKRVGDTSGWQSDVSDDGAPFEFSLAFKEDRAELRFLLEAQGKNSDLQSNWEAGLEINQYLAANFGVSLDRFDRIKDLFAPNNADAKLAIWHAVCIYPDKEPSFKIYLNPQAQGASKSAAVVEESLVRLGFSHAWMGLAEIAAQRGPDWDDCIYFSLDLAADAKARVKIYLRHWDATPADLESALSLATNYVAGDATEFCQAMAPGQDSFDAKPAITCFSFVEGDALKPSNGTIYLPISNYATDDRVVCDRIDLYFLQYGLPVSKYQAAIQSTAKRSLDAGIGMHSYVSLCREQQQQRRLVFYLNPEVNGVRSPGKITDKKRTVVVPSLEDIVSFYEAFTVADHPFLQRLQREAVGSQYIWLTFMNVREAVVTHFSRRLANIVARIEDERIRCILAKQLNEELGNGDINAIHRQLFDRLIAEIEPWRVPSFTEEMLEAGKKFSQQLEDIYFASNPYLGVGAAILMEIQGKQFDLCLGQEFRKTKIDMSNISWLTLHEELEIDHADEALILAGFVADSETGVAAAKQGIHETRTASWQFLNNLYRLCFS